MLRSAAFCRERRWYRPSQRCERSEGGNRMRPTYRFVGSVLAMLMLAPSLALAQGAIAGLVKDTSGAVLPGVTVEAASPVLIEKVRAVTTDGEGRYNIIDLRPGAYVVTF